MKCQAATLSAMESEPLALAKAKEGTARGRDVGGPNYPDCPYEFSGPPADILGQVYEQLLGQVTRLTAGHQEKVEQKPEVRKARGVYYAPTYIVGCAVENVVGVLLEGFKSAHLTTRCFRIASSW